MSEHTKTPWKVQEGFNTIYTLSHGDYGLTKAIVSDCGQCDSEAEARSNARHIVHCVNNHERLVTMLNKMIDNPTSADWQKARALLAALEAEKGGEL